MIRRVLFFLVETGWAAAWAVHLGAPQALPLLPLAGLGAGLARRQHVVSLLVWIAGIAAGVLLAGYTGAAVAVLALWRGATPPDPDQPRAFERIWVALAALTALTLVAPVWSWTVPAVLAVGLLAALEATRVPGVEPVSRLRLAGALALMGLAVGLVAAGVVLWAPWHWLTGVVTWLIDRLGFLAQGLVYLMRSLLHIPKQAHPVRGAANRLPHRPRPTPQASSNVLAAIFYVVTGLLLVALTYWGVRALSRLGTPTVDDVAEAIRREQLGATPYRGGGRATFTRRVVQLRMRLLARRRLGPGQHETVREWVRRLYGDQAGAVEVHQHYEAVRYGGEPDGADRARHVHRQWPSEPKEVPADVSPSTGPRRRRGRARGRGNGSGGNRA